MLDADGVERGLKPGKRTKITATVTKVARIHLRRPNGELKVACLLPGRMRSPGLSAQLNMRLWNAACFLSSSRFRTSSALTFSLSLARLAKLDRLTGPAHSPDARFGLSEAADKAGEGGPRPGEGERSMEVGSSALSALEDARRTRPVAKRPSGSVNADSRGEEGARSMLLELRTGLAMDSRPGNALPVGELDGLVEKKGLGGGNEGDGKGEVEV